MYRSTLIYLSGYLDDFQCLATKNQTEMNTFLWLVLISLEDKFLEVELLGKSVCML